MGMRYQCKPEEKTRTQTLPPALQGRGILDFATSVTTNLKTLIVGDSVAQQLSEAVDESFGMLKSWTRFNETTDDPAMIRRQLLWGCGGYCETLSISYPLRGGGLSAYWRMTDIWKTENKGKALPPNEGGGWNDNQVNRLLDAMPPLANRTFDAVVLNYNNWIRPAGNVTQEQYEDSIRLAASVVGAKAVILVTYPFTRRIDSSTAWEDVHNTNQMLRRVAMDSRSDGLNMSQPLVLVLEFGNFTNQLLWTNARNLGFNVSDPQQVSSDFGWELKDNVTTLMPRLNHWDGGWRIPQVCADKRNNTMTFNCLLNYISVDDMHWCTETVGASFTAGLACLLGCAFNNCAADDREVNAGGRSVSPIDLCEEECNNRFMALSPVDQKWIDANLSIRACHA